MKFKIRETAPPEEKEQVVELTLRYNGGCVMVMANGVIVLWLNDDGTLTRNTTNGQDLKELGFSLNDINQVRFIGE